MSTCTADCETIYKTLLEHDGMTAAALWRELGQPWKREDVDSALAQLRRERRVYKLHNPRGGAEQYHARTEAEIAEAHAFVALREALQPYDETYVHYDDVARASWLLEKILRLPEDERLRLAQLAHERSVAWDLAEDEKTPKDEAP